MPVTARYRPDPLFAKLGPEFADPVAAARFPQHVLRWRNQPWAERVGLDELDAMSNGKRTSRASSRCRTT